MPAKHELLIIAVLFTALACKKSAPEPKQTQPAPVPSSTPPPVLHLPPAAPGKWVESKHYRLRVLDVVPCDEPGTASASSTFRLGVSVEIEALPGKDVSPVFASPKGALLEKDGKIFQAAVHPTPTPTCQALFEPKRLAPGESTRGVLVFEAPDAQYLHSAVLQFKPPRWGREYRADVALPDCFGKSCG